MFVLNIIECLNYSSTFLRNNSLYDILIIKQSIFDNISKVSN